MASLGFCPSLCTDKDAKYPALALLYGIDKKECRRIESRNKGEEMEGGNYQKRKKVCLLGGIAQPKRMSNFNGRKTILQDKKGMGVSRPRVPVSFCCSSLWWAGIFPSLTFICKMRYLDELISKVC